MSKWKNINTAPKDGKPILVCGFGSDGYYVDVVIRDECGFWSFDPYDDSYSIASISPEGWLPLPLPPETT